MRNKLVVTASLLVLLALALSPIAQAEGTSSEKIYPLAPEGIESVPPSTTHSPRHHTAHKHPGSTAPNAAEGSIEGPPQSEGQPEAEEPEQAQAAPPGAGTKHPPGGDGHAGAHHQSKAPNGSGHKPVRNVTATPEGSTTAGTATESAGSGTSPVVPILIAVAVLCALSIGVVFYRERKQGGGPAKGAM